MSTMTMPGGTATPSPGSCTLASAGLMVGTPDPMEGFPSTVSFSMFGFARNTAAAPLTLHGLANYMDSSGPHSFALADQTLQPGQAVNLHLDQAVKLPFQSGMVNLSYTFSGACESLMLSTGSVDATGSYVFEVQPEGVGPGHGRISLYWQVGAGTDTRYSLWNPTAQPVDLMATITFGNQGGVYHLPVHLDPNASSMISIMDLIRKASPDMNGQTIPASTTLGALKITTTSDDLRDTATFVIAGGIFNPVAGTCCINYFTCPGAVSSQIFSH